MGGIWQELLRRIALATAAGTALERSSLRWIVATCVLTAVLSSLFFVGILHVANRIHVGVIPRLAAKLGLLTLEPRLVFAGDSRTVQQIDPALVAEMLGKPRGYAVNIGAFGADPATVLAAARAVPDVFRQADVILSISPYHINDGLKREFLYSTATIAQLGIVRELATFLPANSRTLVWYIQDTFQGAALDVPPPPPSRDGLLAGKLGYEPLEGSIVRFGDGHHYRDMMGSEVEPYEEHNFYLDWHPDGFKIVVVRAALCALRPLVHRLVIVAPPWAPIPEFIGRAAWLDRERDFQRALVALAAECGFEFLPIGAVDGLGFGEFADEAHVNREGMPIYVSHLLRRLGYLEKQPGERF